MKQDYHFKHEQTESRRNRVNFLKPKPAVPINSLRNPSVKKEEKSDYDDISSEKIEERLYKADLIDLSADVKVGVEDIKIYEPKSRKPEAETPDGNPGKTRKILIWAVILGVLGLICLGLGIYFGLNLY